MNKKQFQIEFVFNKVSTQSLWKHLTTPPGLSTWFADEILVDDDTYTFIWNKEEQIAEVVTKKPGHCLRLKWRNDEPQYFFEFKIQTNELTGSTMLTLTDFAEEEELQDAINLWNIQIGDLQRTLGI